MIPVIEISDAVVWQNSDTTDSASQSYIKTPKSIQLHNDYGLAYDGQFERQQASGLPKI